jgi:murein DD-endopeptidase MepM/ murein hydrolase activator NlpD
LSWPILGTVTQRFSRNGPQRHDGIDIAAPKGAIIRAAADGKVIFSDWGPGGYGRLVIVEHTAHIVTVYAHNERNLVQRNQRVKQGQAIATVGRSGRATDYHVHFEVRFKAVPKPPFPLLPQDPAIIQSTHKLYATQGTT